MTSSRWARLGQGAARSAVPIVGDVFQQALRNKWIDQRAEFDTPRPVARADRQPAHRMLL